MSTIKRKKIDKEINRKVIEWLKIDREKIITQIENFDKKRARKAILIAIDPFEKSMDTFVQTYAHKKIPSLAHLSYHADRHDFKISLRKYMRKCIIEQLGYQKYFPELYEVKE